MEGLQIARGYLPGALGRVVELHGEYYHRNWGFGLCFEAGVAADLAEFLRRYDPGRDGFWTASLSGRIEGALDLDGIGALSEGDHLRWLIVSPDRQGRGIGSRLIDAALTFCGGCGYKKVYLWTFEGLNRAKSLYLKRGFKLVSKKRGSRWGKEVFEQKYLLDL